MRGVRRMFGKLRNSCADLSLVATLTQSGYHIPFDPKNPTSHLPIIATDSLSAAQLSAQSFPWFIAHRSSLIRKAPFIAIGISFTGVYTYTVYISAILKLESGILRGILPAESTNPETRTSSVSCPYVAIPGKYIPKPKRPSMLTRMENGRWR